MANLASPLHVDSVTPTSNCDIKNNVIIGSVFSKHKLDSSSII